MRYPLSLSIRCIAFYIVVCVCSAALSRCDIYAQPAEQTVNLKAGFSRISITPLPGTFMTGFGNRDYDHGCEGIHDDLYVRALYLCDGESEVLIMGFDLLFFSRDEADRFKGAAGRVLNLSPAQILLNTSHNHTGPKVGSWYYSPSEPHYLNFLEERIIRAALDARNSARAVTLRAGATKTSAPMNRRKPSENGTIEMRPNRDGYIYDGLPVCLMEDLAGRPVCLLFSVACHPSTIKGDNRAYRISADYPGTAMQYIDDYLGVPASLFLQGAGGDSKPAVIGNEGNSWRSGTWEDVDKAGREIAGEVIQCLRTGLHPVIPRIESALVETELSLEAPLTKAEYERIRDDSETIEPRRRWAQEQVEILNKGYRLRHSVPVLVHGVTLGDGVRIIGIEGEIVARIGQLLDEFYTSGITFPLGYTDGAQLYIPTSVMLEEGGYEVESFWEYRQPAPLKKGIEQEIRKGLELLKSRGIN